MLIHFSRYDLTVAYILVVFQGIRFGAYRIIANRLLPGRQAHSC